MVDLQLVVYNVFRHVPRLQILNTLQHLLQQLGAVAASGATYITPNVALLIVWAAGEVIGLLEIAAMILVLASIALLQIGRQRALLQADQAPDKS